MSNTKFLSTEKALKRQMERIKKKKGKRVANILALKEVEPVEKVVFIKPSSPPAKKAKKRLCPDEENSDDGLVIKFPFDISIYSYPSLMLKRSDQLLFLEDETRLSKIGTSRAIDWGAQLFRRKDVKSLSKKVSSLTSSNVKIKKVLEEARSAEAGAKEAMKGAIVKDAKKEIDLWEQWKKLKTLDVDDDDGDDEEKSVESNEQNDVDVEGKVSEDDEGKVSEDNAEVDPPALP
ncbi:hypothetical protein LWI29_012050 [Acer saccharum]|uniref:Uncharacterized protein n=1 Tax=Acer saccharum TaxID=4024 RepID=A0AA39S9M7_ACESA|nr:hypothetical protein LWI29_012050 [Acer saccharum]KAK1564811.1 hypothetical protein Q3G72_012157 [Acer saccharum]